MEAGLRLLVEGGGGSQSGGHCPRQIAFPLPAWRVLVTGSHDSTFLSPLPGLTFHHRPARPRAVRSTRRVPSALRRASARPPRAATALGRRPSYPVTRLPLDKGGGHRVPPRA